MMTLALLPLALACGHETYLTQEPEVVEVPILVEVPVTVIEEVIYTPHAESYLVAGSDPAVVDIVFIVDQSCSMADNLNDIQVEMSDLWSILIDARADFHMGLTTADDHHGAFVQDFWLDNTASLMDVILYVGNLPLYSYYLGEEGLGSAVTLLGNQQYSGFFRDDADLFWIFISDEDDQSAWSSADWLDLWVGYKDPPFGVYASSVTILDPSLCTYHEGTGQAYIDVSIEAADICDEDWSSILTPIEETINVDHSFTLLEAAIPSSIQVWVNDSLMTTADWTYTETTKELLLHYPVVTDAYVFISYAAQSWNTETVTDYRLMASRIFLGLSLGVLVGLLIHRLRKLK